MARPPFSLTDEQARVLVVRVAELQADYPLNARNHRPFVRAFLQAVFEATGQVYSPAIYHRLLAAYAPDRRPSTTTIAAEKHAFNDRYAIVTAPSNPTSATRLGIDVKEVREAVADAVDAALSRSMLGISAGNTEVEFLASRLRDTEQQLQQVRADAARLAAALAAANEAATLHAQDAERSRLALVSQAAAVAELTTEVSNMRKFALQSIDEARGETRLWKEHYAALEGKRRVDATLLETFRQQAYRLGAAIPETLRHDKSV